MFYMYNLKHSIYYIYFKYVNYFLKLNNLVKFYVFFEVEVIENQKEQNISVIELDIARNNYK